MWELYQIFEKQSKIKCVNNNDCFEYIMKKITENQFKILKKYDCNKGAKSTYVNIVVRNKYKDFIRDCDRLQKLLKYYDIDNPQEDSQDILLEVISKDNFEKIKTIFQKLQDKNRLSKDEILIYKSILYDEDNSKIGDRLNISNKRFHSIKNNLIQKLRREYIKVYGSILSIILILFIGDKILEEDKIIYKSGKSDFSKLEIPIINKSKSLCSIEEQNKAQEYLEKSYPIAEDSIEYFKLLSSSIKACYSPEVMTKLYIIKAYRESNITKKIELLKEGLYHSSQSLNVIYRINKEIEILERLEKYYDGIDKKDIINKIEIRKKELNEISKSSN